MNFGLFTDIFVRDGMTQAEAFTEALDEIDTIEQLGMDEIWLAEHHFNPQRGLATSPLVIASAIAARTSRIRIGLGVQVLPLANPLRLAEEAAIVDQISQGRLDFGVGRSGFRKTYQSYNIDYENSRDMFLESLEVLKAAWTEEHFSHEGEYYTFHDANVTPKPYQQPYPPIPIAAQSADSFPLAGRLGHPILIRATGDISRIQESMSKYWEAREEAGFTGPEDVILRIATYVAETEEMAINEPKSSVRHLLDIVSGEQLLYAGNQSTADLVRRMASLPYDEYVQSRCMFGTPESVTEQLQILIDRLGITGLMMEMNYGGQIPQERVMNSVRMFMDEVAPNFN